MTYKVIASEMPEIDIATTRKERYRKPGALPNVSEGRLEDDLLRRDFSVNAMAIDLIHGGLHDPTNARRDLDQRVIRALHERSFIDDPTRIYRAIRLALRLGFTLESNTEEWLSEAIAAGALDYVSKERLWRELFLAMDEPDVTIALIALQQSGAMGALFPAPHIDRNLLRQIEQRIAADSDLDRYIFFTGVLLGPHATAAHLEGSGFSQKRSKTALQIARDLDRVDDALAEARTDRQRFRLYRSLSPEMLSLLAIRSESEAASIERFHSYRTFKLPLRGNDLEVPSGPHIARALERTREAVFNGEIPPAEARTFARRVAMEYLSRES
jgi:tRNA nucleotidyltransferase (CCA-adding enzyme)